MQKQTTDLEISTQKQSASVKELKKYGLVFGEKLTCKAEKATRKMLYQVGKDGHQVIYLQTTDNNVFCLNL